jgi:hypothetical protein
MHNRLVRTVARAALIAVGMAGVTGMALPAGAAGHTHTATHSHAQSRPNWHLSRGKSVNWAGYVAQGGPFTSISGSWRVPSVDCSVTPSGDSANWVGIDGSGSRTVEQTGTLSECQRGTPIYAAWVEFFPAPLKIFAPSSFPLSAGDSMSASVVLGAKSTFFATLVDHTAGWTATASRKHQAQRVSAEAIAEAPSGAGGVLPLADFGTTSFNGVTVNGSALSAFSPDRVVMTTHSGVVKATPGALSGGDFSVTWQHS